MRIKKSTFKRLIKEELQAALEGIGTKGHHNPDMEAAMKADCSKCGKEGDFEGPDCEVCTKLEAYNIWKSKLPKDEDGDSVFPKNMFKDIRKKWWSAYDPARNGANKLVWIKKLIKQYVRAKRVPREEFHAHKAEAIRMAHDYYRDNIWPLVKEAVWKTKVYAGEENFYIDFPGESIHGVKKKPGIYINASPLEVSSEASVYNTFHHELGHAVDDRLSAHSIGKLKQSFLQFIQAGQEMVGKDVGQAVGAGVYSKEARKNRPSQTQLALIKKIMPDTDNRKAIKTAKKLRARAKEDDDSYTAYLMDPHGFKSWEIYSNIIDSRVRMGALFTCEDVARLRNPTLIMNYVDWEEGDKVNNSMEGDLAGALQRAAMFKKMDDCEIAKILNQIASLGGFGKPRGKLKPGETKQDRRVKARAPKMTAEARLKHRDKPGPHRHD